jgi:hypothetical protein
MVQYGPLTTWPCLLCYCLDDSLWNFICFGLPWRRRSKNYPMSSLTDPGVLHHSTLVTGGPSLVTCFGLICSNYIIIIFKKIQLFFSVATSLFFLLFLNFFPLTNWCKISPKKSFNEEYSFMDSWNFHPILITIQKRKKSSTRFSSKVPSVWKSGFSARIFFGYILNVH